MRLPAFSSPTPKPTPKLNHRLTGVVSVAASENVLESREGAEVRDESEMKTSSPALIFFIKTFA